MKRVVPCRCRTGTLQNPARCLWRWEPDRRYIFFFNPPAHLCRYIYRQKGGDLTLSYDKSPYTHGNVKRAVTTQTTSQKSSIKQRLRTDLGRSVGVTTATQLVWLTWFTGPTFPLPATACRKRRLNGAMCRNHRMKRVVPCRCRTGTLQNPARCLWRWEPDRRYIFFFNPPAHLCRYIYDFNVVACDVKHQ